MLTLRRGTEVVTVKAVARVDGGDGDGSAFRWGGCGDRRAMVVMMVMKVVAVVMVGVRL